MGEDSRAAEIKQEGDQKPPINDDQAPAAGTKPRKSTITASEQAVFDRILNEISQHTPKRDGQGEDDEGYQNLEHDYLEEDSVEDADLLDDPRQQLAAIFEVAVAKNKEQTPQASELEIRKNGFLNNHSFADDVDLSSNSHHSAPLVNESPFRHLNSGKARRFDADGNIEGILNRAINDHKQYVESALDGATSGTEIWAILDKEVFKLMSHLNLQMKLDEKQRKASLRQQTKAAKLVDNSGKDINTTQEGISSIKATTKKPILTLTTPLESIALTTNSILSILKSNYAHCCLHALRRFRDRNLSSSYALKILPHLKSLGPVSYVLGASGALYNEILYQKWDQFHDVQGLADLMEEMVNQGVSPDVTTLRFLRFVDRCRRRDLSGRNGPAKRTWWALRPIKEGWRRVKDLYTRFREEIAQLDGIEMETVRKERWDPARKDDGAIRRAGVGERSLRNQVPPSVISSLAAMSRPEDVKGTHVYPAWRPLVEDKLRDGKFRSRTDPTAAAAASQAGSALKDWD